FSRTKSLRGVFSADLNFPGQDPAVVNIKGTTDVLLSPDKQYFHIGWPFPANATTVTILGKDGKSKFPAIKGGFAIDFKPEQRVLAAVLWEGDFFKMSK